MPLLAFLAAIMRRTRSSGMGSPLRWWRVKPRNTSGCQHQCSSICDGASTKSRSTLVPEKRR